MTNKEQQAFPAPAGVAHITEQGMTLRDYFAAKAMQSYLSRLDMDVVPTKEHNQFKSICITSYYVAAEMMIARKE